jgi:hypothetical protein
MIDQNNVSPSRTDPEIDPIWKLFGIDLDSLMAHTTKAETTIASEFSLKTIEFNRSTSTSLVFVVLFLPLY